jgi:hypothetical protein
MRHREAVSCWRVCVIAGYRRTDCRPHRRILGLLLAGLTDQAIGNQLKLSLRTVQRRVRALMDQVGAETGSSSATRPPAATGSELVPSSPVRYGVAAR